MTNQQPARVSSALRNSTRASRAIGTWVVAERSRVAAGSAAATALT